MDGWSTLIIINWAGLTFVFFWIIGSIRKERLWGNLLLLISWWIALYATTVFWRPALRGILALAKPSSDGQMIVLGLGMAVAWILFLIFLGILRSATDSLSKVKVAFHPWVDTIGTILCMLSLWSAIWMWTWPVSLVLTIGKIATLLK